MKKKYKEEEYPVFEIYVSEDDASGVRLVSLVEDPAIQMKGMAFSQKETIKSFDFKAQKDQQIIVGPAMVPNKKILRKDEDGNKYFVVFKADTIRKMVEKFNRNGTNRRINIDHTNKMVDAYIMENWIVEDEYYDKSRKYGFEVPIGTWMVAVKVEDEKFWREEVKENGKYGFSVEGIMGQKPMNYSLSEIKLEDYIDGLSEEEILHLFNEVEEERILEYFKSKGKVIEDGMNFADDLEDFVPSQRVYVYSLKPGTEGPFIKENSRPFCRHMHEINRYWTEEDVAELTNKLGYNFWDYFGSYNCRHTLKPVIITKNTNPVKEADINKGVAEQEASGLLGFSCECGGCEECKKRKQEFKIEPKSGETEREFISRCIPFEINNGREQDQAIAICYSIWDGK